MRTSITLSMTGCRHVVIERLHELLCDCQPCHFRALKESGRPDGAHFANWQTWPNTLQACHRKHRAPGDAYSMAP